MPPVSLRPDDILCGEIGSPDDRRWSAPVADLSRADAEALEGLCGGGVLECRGVERHVQVAGVDQVGQLALPSGRRVWIRPKVGNLVLLDWLAYLGDVPPPSKLVGGNTA